MPQLLYMANITQFNQEKLEFQNSLPLMSGPVPLVCIMATYLLFVLKLGPFLMAHRKPYNLQALIVVYNFMMVLYSVVLVSWPIVGGQMKYIFAEYCKMSKNPDDDVLHSTVCYGWFYFFSKIVELADTVFFVLRKKPRQITFLHVFHHVGTAGFVWFHNKYIPGPQGVVVSVLNSFVHVFMYTYYMLAAMGPQYQKYIWWKKYLTWIQMVQFVILFLYNSSLLLLNCGEPVATSIYFLVISLAFLSLFANFYYQAFVNKPKHS